jgi:ElaB/YqjD/DUF883 family membrane-anchored ribosome-binding protein
MQASANEPLIPAATDATVEELNRIVAQAESLLHSLGSETSQAASAVRDRVTDTLQQAKARLADTAAEASVVAESLAERADQYVRKNPWQSAAIAALLGAAAAYLLTRASRRD